MKIYGVTGWKDMGKTTLVVELVRLLSARGLRIATVKHAHHGVELDQPGRDSYRHREAGAAQVMVASASRIAVIEELRDAPEPALADLLPRLEQADLVLVEGYKAAPHRKLEVYRSEAAGGRTPIAADNASVRAIVGDAEGAPVPVLDPADLEAIAEIVLADAEEVR